MDSGKKRMKKRLLAMLLASALLLSGISINYFTQDTGNTESIAVSEAVATESTEQVSVSQPIELAKSQADAEPMQADAPAEQIVEVGSKEVVAVSGFGTGSITEDSSNAEEEGQPQPTSPAADPAEGDVKNEEENSSTDDNGAGAAEAVNAGAGNAEAGAAEAVNAEAGGNTGSAEAGNVADESINAAVAGNGANAGAVANDVADSSIADSIVSANASADTLNDKAEEENTRIVNSGGDDRISEIIAEDLPQNEDVVDFIVVLDKEPLLDAFSSEEVKANTDAVSAYRAEQERLIDELKSALKASFGAEEGFSLGYDYTVSTTGISVRTRYANQEAIGQMPGVKKVYVAPTFKMSTVVEQGDSGMYTNNSPGMIGATEINDSGFTGKGMKIAIIDTGIVVDHPSFRALPDNKLTDDSMTEAFVEEVWDSLKAGQTTSLRNQAYHNSKLPFVFNYYSRNFDVSHATASHDHGTHVAGIAAANKVDTIGVVGVAPDAQLIVMQVFNPSGGADWATIMAALEDCVTLDVDAVNLSLGSPAGFTDGDVEMDAVLDKFDNTDIHVVIAGGNDTNNAYMNLTGTDMSKTKDIDNGLIGTPATASRALSVASADNDGADLPYFTVVGDDNKKIGFSDSALTIQTNFLDNFAEQELDFVVIDGIGDVGDYGTTDVTGKVVVVARGKISFQEKQQIAQEKGAVALVVYNNIPGSFAMAISDGDGHIPCVAISRSDGEYLVGKKTGKLTVCSEGQLTHVSVDRAMSSFSSWGVTPDLKLKPEITGVGGNIYSTRDPQLGGSNYGNMSGTSMASPQVAGAVTVLTQYLKETYRTRYENDELRRVATNLLMSTASQIQEGETVYSPRFQGAGLVDLKKAIAAGAYLSNPGAYDTRPKAEMGDNDTKTGVFTFQFDITNITGSPKTYTFDSTILSPDVDETGKFMTNTTKALEGATLKVKNGNAETTSVSVPANGKVSLTATITLTAENKSFIDDNFENGTYVEGYLYVKETGGTQLSMPFLGFYGDWSDAPVFDEHGEAASLYSPTIRTRKSVLGQNPYMRGGKGGDQYNAISNGNPIEEMIFGMMRNSRKITQRVTSTDGNNTEYFTLDEEYIVKTYYSTTYGMIIPFSLFNFNEEVYIWDGTNKGATLPDGTKAKYRIESYLDDGDETLDDFYEFEVTIDNIKPQIVNSATLSEDITKDTTNGTVELTLKINENHYVAAVMFESLEGVTLGKYEVENTPGQELTKTFEVTGYGTDFTVIVADYACNETEVDVSLDLSDMPTTQPEPETLDKDRIYGNETYSDGYVSMGWFSALKSDFSDLRNETFDMENRTYSGEYINGYVIAQRASDGALMLLTPYKNYWHTKVIWKQSVKAGVDGAIVLYDMAMNYSDDKLYATGWLYKGDNDGDSKDDGYNALFEIKLEETVSVEEVAKISGLGEGIDALTLGCTTAGQFYTISSEGSLYKLSNTGAVELVGETDFVNKPNYSGVNVIQSMCYDHDGQKMYWYAHSQTYHAGSYINVGATYTIDLDTAECTEIGGSGSSGYTSLFVPTSQTSDIFTPRVTATGIEITPSTMKMAKGQTRRMSVEWKPWNAIPGTVEWRSDKTDIVEVNSNGVVKAIAPGEATITATATVGTETITHTAKVTVVESADALYGFVIRDYNGQVGDSSWITYSDSNPSDVTRIGGGGMIQGGTYYEGHVYFVIAEGEPMSPIKDTVLYKSVVTEGETPDKTTIGSPVEVGRTEGIEVGNIAFDYTTGRLYGVDYTNGGLCLVDIDTGAVDPLGAFNGDLSKAIMPAMCVTSTGKVIGSDMLGNLYHVNPDDMRATNIGSIEPDTWFYAGMTYDHNTGNIYWNPCMNEDISDLYLVQLDERNPSIDTTEIINLGGVSGDKGVEQTAMFTIPYDEPETTYIQATKIEITNGETLTGLIGGTMQLTTRTEPSRPSTHAREWESSNPEVVSVDRFGKLTFKKEGTATVKVTVRNKGDAPLPPCTDTATVNVYPAAGDLVAFLATDEGATGYFDFWIKIKDYAPQQSEAGTSMIGSYSLRCGDYYDGYFYAYNDAGDLYRINKDNYEDYVTLGNHNLGDDDQVIGMAFDYSTGTMYAITLHKGGQPGKLMTLNLGTGVLTEVATLSNNISTIATDDKGTLYGVGSSNIYDTSYLYTINKADGTCTQLQAIPEAEVWTGDNYISERMYSPQMTFDRGTNRLYLHATIRHKTFNSVSFGLYMIQLKGEGESKTVDFIAGLGKPALQLRGDVKVGDMYLGLLCSVPDDDEVVSDVVTGIRVNRESARVEKGNTTQLSAIISPGGAKDKRVTWSSGDEAIATVDENGLVTGVSAGTTTITVTSVSNSEVSATCTLTVVERAEGDAVSTAYTISAKQEALVSFDPELPATTAKRIVELSGGRRIIGMDIKDDNTIYYAVDTGVWPELFRFDLRTQRSTSMGLLMVFVGGASDMAYDPVNQLIYVASGFYIFQFEEDRLQTSELIDYAGYLDTTKLEITYSQMHAVTCKDGRVYFLGSANGATLYSVNDKFKDFQRIRSVGVNTVSGQCEMAYDTNTSKFYLTDAGDRIYSFTEDGEDVTLIDVLGNGWDLNGFAINTEGAPDMPALPEIPDQPDNPDPVDPETPEIPASDIITEEVIQGGKIDLTDNIRNLPEGATVEVVTNVSSDKVGSFKGKVKVTFANGTSREVEIPVIVKAAGTTDPVAPEIPASDIIPEEVIQGGKIDLTDNIKNLPEGAKVEVVTNVASDKVGSFKGKVKVTFANGTSREVEIPVTVKAAGTEPPVEPPVERPWPFTDVAEIAGHWKYENIKYVYYNDIMNGIAGTTLFQPDHPLTRAMFATVIYRMAGEPDVAFENKFTDVEDGRYYSKAIIWANKQGIVQGFGDGSYGVNTNITREQIAKMLFEYAKNRGFDVSGATELTEFTDADTVNSWAIGYVKWAVNTAMITGKPNDEARTSFRIDPRGEATRAECAKMLTEFMKKYQDPQG